MQRYELYFMAMDCLKKHGGNIDEGCVRRYVNDYRKKCLYEPDFSAFAKKNQEIGKQESMDSYVALWFIIMLLLAGMNQSITCKTDGESLYEMVLKICTDKNVETADVTNGFLYYMIEPADLSEEYICAVAEAYHLQEEYRVVSEMDTKELQALLSLLYNDLPILKKTRTSNSPELKLLYEVWFTIMAVLTEFYDLEDCGETSQLYSDILKELQNAAIIWVYSGGCRSFSIAYYEQRHQWNHYRNQHREVDYNQGNRWLRFIHELKEDLEVWQTIGEDVGTIQRCRQYILEEGLLSEQEMTSMELKLREHIEEIRYVLSDIIEHIHQTDTELAKKFIQLKREISID